VRDSGLKEKNGEMSRESPKGDCHPSIAENQTSANWRHFGPGLPVRNSKRRGSIRAPAINLTNGKMNMKSIGCLIGLVALCVMKVTLVWTIWCCVVGALALIGAARVFYLCVTALAADWGGGWKMRSRTPRWLLFSLSASLNPQPVHLQVSQRRI
jgi:hypothetical protein